MNHEKEIISLHNAGYVILQASRSTNAPIGWKRKTETTKKWGYVEEMSDPKLSTYYSTFNASILAKSHCGFYLGHNNLCCIDLDTKKSSTTIEQTQALANSIALALGEKVALERTKSNGFHIYFRYKAQPNIPDWTGIKLDGKSNNWIELYYSKRFIACYLSNSKKYKLEHGNILTLEELTDKEHEKLLSYLKPFKGKETKTAKRKSSTAETDKETWEEAEHFVRQIEDKGLDITGDNPTWFRIGKSFANAFGEKGFDMFNRVSQFSPTYNEDDIQETYTRFVENDAKKTSKKRITIATFFGMCLDAGLSDRRTSSTSVVTSTSTKEFEIIISKKDSMAEKCRIVVDEFIKNVHICCLDKVTFYVFKDSHWIQCTSREVIELLLNFISRSTIDQKYMGLYKTVPYLKMMLEGIRMLTERKSIEPRTGNLHDGVYINLENGILHIDLKNKSYKMLDWDQSFNFTTVLPFCYDDKALCPRFDAWINAQIPDKDLHVAYYAFVASCFTKHKADIIMMLTGETSTGKSSLIDITRRIVGLENSVPISASTLFGGNGNEAGAQAMQMENKLLAYDFDAQSFKFPELLLKVAAQEPIQGWQMYVSRRFITNYGRLIVATNPQVWSTFSKAIARRFVTINMNVPVIKDNTVMPAIYENELAGIFNRVLSIGLKHLIDNGGQIKRTEKIEKATLDFHMSGKDITRYMEYKNYVPLRAPTIVSTKTSQKEKYEQVNPGVKIIQTSLTDMYADFRVWMEDVEGYHVSKVLLRKFFVKDLADYNIQEQVYREKSGLKRGVFIGQKNE